MAYTVKKVNVWAGEIADRPGGLASTLAALQAAGSNIEFLVARRAPDKPGTGVVFLTPISGVKQKGAAQRAGNPCAWKDRTAPVWGRKWPMPSPPKASTCAAFQPPRSVGALSLISPSTTRLTRTLRCAS
jgi:hypothetical protein